MNAHASFCPIIRMDPGNVFSSNLVPHTFRIQASSPHPRPLAFNLFPPTSHNNNKVHAALVLRQTVICSVSSAASLCLNAPHGISLIVTLHHFHSLFSSFWTVVLPICSPPSLPFHCCEFQHLLQVWRMNYRLFPVETFGCRYS